MPEKRTIPRICEQCGKPFLAKGSLVKRGQSRFCSRACSDKRSPQPHVRTPLEDRFWAKVDKRGPDDCWLWTGTCINSGYGKIGDGGKCSRNRLAHRVAWELANGPIPEGLYVCHNCPNGDNKLCCNPSHLFLGTHQENVRDALTKGQIKTGSMSWPTTHIDRIPRGEQCTQAILNAESVRAIRDRYAAGGISQYALAREYGVTVSAINLIILRKNWQHIE